MVSESETTSVQVMPGTFSSSHSALQPSPSMMLLSSHSSTSPGNLMPSPQREVQAPALQSGSSEQVGVQPSHHWSFPSSQGSWPSRAPSPQLVSAQTLGAPSHL